MVTTPIETLKREKSPGTPRAIDAFIKAPGDTVGVMEFFHTLLESGQNCLTEAFNVLCAAHRHKIVPADMAHKGPQVPLVHAIFQNGPQEPDDPVPLFKPELIVKGFEMVQIEIEDRKELVLAQTLKDFLFYEVVSGKAGQGVGLHGQKQPLLRDPFIKGFDLDDPDVKTVLDDDDGIVKRVFILIKDFFGDFFERCLGFEYENRFHDRFHRLAAVNGVSVLPAQFKKETCLFYDADGYAIFHNGNGGEFGI